jgi:hypothetical protein
MSSDIVRRKIAVFDGQLVDPFTVTHLDGVFRIETIAHAMSMLCRYGGHVSRFYSVAEHCLLVESVVERRINDMPSIDRLRLCMRRYALIHDASEAYLIDLPAPLKHMDTMREYREVEARLLWELRQWFGVCGSDYEFVTNIDVEIRGTEARQLFRVIPPKWEAKLAPVIPGIQCGTMSPIEAKTAWLAKFRELWFNWKD